MWLPHSQDFLDEGTANPDSLVCMSIKPFNARLEELNTVLDDVEIEKLEKKPSLHKNVCTLTWGGWAKCWTETGLQKKHWTLSWIEYDCLPWCIPIVNSWNLLPFLLRLLVNSLTLLLSLSLLLLLPNSVFSLYFASFVDTKSLNMALASSLIKSLHTTGVFFYETPLLPNTHVYI